MRGLEGRVAFITGAARGQGRSHALGLAREGADIVAVDCCRPIDTVAYPLASPEDLEETARLVRDGGGRIVAYQADVRDLASLESAAAAGLNAFGRLDIVIANAGIAPFGGSEIDMVRTFRDVIDVNLVGTWNTLKATVPQLIEQGRGGSIVLIGSTASFKGMGGHSAGEQAYVASKHGVVGLMRSFAINLARFNIRVNSVHPTGVRTPMVINDVMKEFLESRPATAAPMLNLLPVSMVEPEDVTNAVAWLSSDESRYVTGVSLPVDAGYTTK